LLSLVITTSRSFPHSRLVTGFVIRLTRRVPLVEQELFTLPEHIWVHPRVFSWVHVTRSLVLYVMFCRSLFVLLYFFFWPLCCLSFDLQILITPLVSTNTSYDATAFLQYRIFLVIGLENLIILCLLKEELDRVRLRFCWKIAFEKIMIFISNLKQHKNDAEVWHVLTSQSRC
jgi:hypothetical protein